MLRSNGEVARGEPVDEACSTLRTRLTTALSIVNDYNAPQVHEFLTSPDPTQDLGALSRGIAIANTVVITVEFSRIDMCAGLGERAVDEYPRHYVLVPCVNLENYSVGVTIILSQEQFADTDFNSPSGLSKLPVAVGRYARNNITGELLCFSNKLGQSPRGGKVVSWIGPPDGLKRTCVSFECDRALFEAGHVYDSVRLSVYSSRVVASSCRACLNKTRNIPHFLPCTCVAQLKQPMHALDFSRNLNNFSVQAGVTAGITSILAPSDITPSLLFFPDSRCIVNFDVHRDESMVNIAVKSAQMAFVSLQQPKILTSVFVDKSSLSRSSSFQANDHDGLPPQVIFEFLENIMDHEDPKKAITSPECGIPHSCAPVVPQQYLNAANAASYDVRQPLQTNSVDVALSKEIKRKLSNRASAARSNARRKKFYDDLSQAVESAKERAKELKRREEILVDENEFLRQLLSQLSGRL